MHRIGKGGGIHDDETGVSGGAGGAGSGSAFGPAGGTSCRSGEGVRAGAEPYAEMTVKGAAPSWQVIGPTVSLTRGRFWGAATFGPGLLGVREAGRITFGGAL